MWRLQYQCRGFGVLIIGCCDFGGYDLWWIWSWGLWTTWYPWFWGYRSLEVAILEVASFGGYGLGVFNTHPAGDTGWVRISHGPPSWAHGSRPPGASPRPDEHYVHTGAYPAGSFVPRTTFHRDHVVGSHPGYRKPGLLWTLFAFNIEYLFY